MPSSDSEDFESADEGQSHFDKKERKARLSSSNYSDSPGPESDPKQPINSADSKSGEAKDVSTKLTDGWDDFEIDENDIPVQSKSEPASKVDTKITRGEQSESISKNENITSKDTGWDDFDDWGQDATSTHKNEPQPEKSQPEPSIKEVTDRMAAASTGGWGWGWNVDSLLSSATAGISTITSHVSQGISTVLESGIGAPEPEELARRTVREPVESEPKKEQPSSTIDSTEQSASDAFPFGSLFSGVTKFVETTGTKVISGGLDTLETIGKKTMEVLQDGDPGLAKKRAMLGLDAGDRPVLSQVLREAKAKAEEEDKDREQKREAKEVHYENLFDDYEGLVHLEALEMLSKQVSMRIEDKIRSVEPDKRLEIKETLQQVAELCEITDEDEDDDPPSEELSKPDAFLERLQTATQDVGVKIQFQELVKQYTTTLSNLSTPLPVRSLYKCGVSSLAHSTALSVQLYHKVAEMMLVNVRRSTADEADALTRMTSVLTKHISELATLYTEKLNSMEDGDKEQINTYITNLFLEAGNSSTYIQNAFQLTLPIIQIGAV